MRSESGFTLVEIMIVLAIVAIGTTLAFTNLNSWNRHNQFVGFQRQVFSELHEARTRATSMHRQYRIAVDLDAETVTLERGDAGSGSTAWTVDRAVVSAPFEAQITDIVTALGAASTTVTGSTLYLMFNPAGDVYRWSGGAVTPLDNAAIHLSGGVGETATIQLFCWTGKARLSNGTI